jgi:hypothetical protein
VRREADDGGRPRAAEDPEGELVGHGPRGDEHGGVLAHERRVALLEGTHRRVLPVRVVADVGGGHRPAHGVGRAGERVGAEVYDAVGHPPTLEAAHR